MLAIFGKKKANKHFLPFDFEHGALVHSRLSMTVFDDKQRSSVENAVAFMNVHNPMYEFQLRSVKYSSGMIFAKDYQRHHSKTNRKKAAV